MSEHEPSSTGINHPVSDGLNSQSALLATAAVKPEPAASDLATLSPEVVRARRRVFLLIIAGLAVTTVGGWWLNQRGQATTAELAVRCKQLSENKQWDELERLASEWSTREPKRFEPWLYRAEVAEARREFDAMVKLMEQAPDDDPRTATFLTQKASTEFEVLNRPWDGLRTCDRILRLDPRVLYAHKQPIFFCAMTLQRGEMIRRIRAAIRARRESPESYIFLAGASWFYGASLYRLNERWLQNDPDNETFTVAQVMQICMSEAKTNLEIADKYKHIPFPEELLPRFPHNLELLAYLIDQAVVGGDLERVQELLAAVRKEEGDRDARIWRARSWLADGAGDLEAAEYAARKAFEFDPYWMQIPFMLHDVLRRRGQPAEAERFHKVYEATRELGYIIRQITDNQPASKCFDDKTFQYYFLTAAEAIDDAEVVAAFRERLDL